VAVPAIGFVLFSAATLGLAWSYSRSDYLRRYSDKSWMELPLKAEEYRAGLAEFWEKVEPGDLIFTTYQTILYLEMDSGKVWVPVATNLGRLNCRGYDWFFITQNGAAHDWGMPPAGEARRMISSLALLEGLRLDRRVWIVNTGWNGPVDWMTTNQYWSARVRKLETPGVGIYMAPAGNLK
jgi:hypothetical protein